MHNNPELLTEQIAGIVMDFTWVELNDGFMIGKPNTLAKNDNTSAIADHVKTTGHNIKWDKFDILATGKTDYHCKIRHFIYSRNLSQLSMSSSEEKS